MASKFYVEPANPLAGLGAITQGLEAMQQRKEADRLKSLQGGLIDVLRTQDPDKVFEYVKQNPEVTSIAPQMMKAVNEITVADKVNKAKKILLEGADPASTYMEHAQTVIDQGGNPAETLQVAKMSAQDPKLGRRQAEIALSLLDPESYAAYQSTKPKAEKIPDDIARWNKYQELLADDPQKAESFARAVLKESPKMEVAGIKEFEYLTEGLAPEEKKQAKKVKLGLDPRASEGAEAKAEKKFAEETAKLSAQLNLEPRVAGAVTAAKNEADAMASAVGTKKSNSAAWAIYESGIKNLGSSLGKTSTGPISGRMPAITANAQTAEGAVAVMAPILKQMFRASGEGIFTDKDQELLLKMVPDRKMHPEARNAQLMAIDSIVRAKLMKKDEAPKEAEPARKIKFMGFE